jgi:hypothetical protein
MKKFFIVLVIVIIGAAAGYGIFRYFSARSGNQSGNEPAQGTGALLPAVGVSTSSDDSAAVALPDYLGTASQVFGDVPTSSLLAIGTAKGTVMVDNFYAANPPVVEGGLVVVAMAPNYRIVYDPAYSSFWLAITGTPFETWQAVAEQALLSTLRISEADACKLSVTSGILYQSGNPLDGKSFPLSFCD